MKEKIILHEEVIKQFLKTKNTRSPKTIAKLIIKMYIAFVRLFGRIIFHR